MLRAIESVGGPFLSLLGTVWALEGHCEHWPIKVLKSHHNMDVHNMAIQSADVPSVGVQKKLIFLSGKK